MVFTYHSRTLIRQGGLRHWLSAGGIISANDRALTYHPSVCDRQTDKQTIEISMTIRLATYDDIPAIMPVIDAAREMMHASGNVNQWINGYPSEEVIQAEIALRVLWCSWIHHDRILYVFGHWLEIHPRHADRVFCRLLSRTGYSAIYCWYPLFYQLV